MADNEEDDMEVPTVDETLMVTSGELPPGICIEIISDGSSVEPVPSTSAGKATINVTQPIAQPVYDFTLDTELTLQYLTGKITFLEFSETMEKMVAADKAEGGEETESMETGKDEDMDRPQKVKESCDKRKGKEVKKIRRRRCDVPKHLEATMGEINLMYAHGDYDEAIKECMEVIRQAPQASKPFQTLGMIYENLGDTPKSHQYFMIAAYLDPSDEDEWLRLAELCREQNDINQAIRCYSQAIKVTEVNKTEYIWERSRLYEELKDYKKALDGYQAILPLLSADDSQLYFNLAWAITRSYHELGEKDRALATITKAFQDHPEQIAAEDVNLLLELQIPAKLHMESIEDFQFVIMTAGLLANNAHRAYTFARPFVIENINNKQAWNMFIQVIMMTNDQRHNRFCLRRMLHEPTNIALGIMNAHNSMASGSYKHALGEYANVFRRTPTDPMISLCIGLNFIHIASQRFSAKRHSLVSQGLAFFNNYIQLRGDCQETYFNLGRALHQINILYAAVHYYKKVLEMAPCTGEKKGKYDLSKEAAFNLSLIYQASGSMDYARYLLYTYCTV